MDTGHTPPRPIRTPPPNPESTSSHNHSPTHRPALQINTPDNTHSAQSPAMRPPGPHISPSIEKLDEMDTVSEDARRESSHRGLLGGIERLLPALPHARVAGDNSGERRSRTMDTHVSAGRRSNIDWIVPVDEKPPRRMAVGERLQPTIDTAEREKTKYETRAKFTGLALNVAIGLQVLLGSLTTGLSAVAASGGKSTAVSTTILGALATLVASYLARARGSNEPELSITRVKDLEHYLRDCKAFQMDHGHIFTDEFDGELIRLRGRFEELLGNASGERKLAPPV